jgi:hypothetical protein
MDMRAGIATKIQIHQPKLFFCRLKVDRRQNLSMCLTRPPVRAWLVSRWEITVIADNRTGTSNLWSLPLDGGPMKQLTDFKPELCLYL